MSGCSLRILESLPPVSTVGFEYRLTGTGWAKAHLRVGGSSVELSASYLNDALGDLVRAAAAIASGASQACLTWMEEPGEFRWILMVHDDHTLHLTIRWFDDWGYEDDAEGRELLHASCPVRSFCEAIVDGAQRGLDLHGAAGCSRGPAMPMSGQYLSAFECVATSAGHAREVRRRRRPGRADHPRT